MSSGTEAIDRKQRIRDRYRGVDTSELEVIPAKIVEGLGGSTSIRRVAAYVRVSTDNDEQTSSYELQKNYYTDYIKAQPGWEFVGIYDDEGISGTSLAHRKGMQQLIEDCKAGKIDLILTKSIARFARNIVDCLSVIETLKNLDPPVGVKFEADNIYTLDSNGRMILTILASVAEEESHSKSIIMNWSIDRRFSRGLFLTPALLGYDQDEDGNLVVNQDEAQTVKVIYYLYLNGFSLKDIAELLTDYERKTKLGNTEWNPGTIAGIIANERHCGDVLARKTFTPNFLTHKAKKNNNDRTQYRQRDHHEAIVSRDVFSGQLVEQGGDKLMLFELDQPEMIKVEEIVLPPKEEESEGETVKKTIYIFPPEWAGTFGQPITSVAQIGILQQEHYAGNWDVLRPASEIKEMNIFTADGLNTLLHEAEEIMEGWIDIDGGKQNVDAAEGAGIGD